MAQPYRELSAAYLDQGVRTFPVDGKRPCIRNYNRVCPGATAMAKWAGRFGGANIGLLTRRSSLAVVDVDDLNLVDYVLSVAGPTPLRVRTVRGEHLYYRDPQRQFAGVSRPDGRAYDLKAAGSSDFVLIPGSSNGEATYEIVGYDGDDVASEFARRLRAIPELSLADYNELTPRARVEAAERWTRGAGEGAVIMEGAKVAVGRRNRTLFLAGCRDAHDARRQYGDSDEGLRALERTLARYNETTCELPLPGDEISRIAASAWSRTLSGKNRPPKRSGEYAASFLRRMGKNVRALALWGWLTQETPDITNFELSPLWLAAHIMGWKRHDGVAAIQGLVSAGVLEVLDCGGQGRGRVARYRLTEVFVSPISFDRVLRRMNGDSAAAVLLAFVVDTHGPNGRPFLSAGGMSEAVGGPFGGWTKVGIRKAYTRLTEAGLLVRLVQRRVSLKAPPALFQIRASDVLKMPGNVPVSIHAPPYVDDPSARARRGEKAAGEGFVMIVPGLWTERV